MDDSQESDVESGRSDSHDSENESGSDIISAPSNGLVGVYPVSVEIESRSHDWLLIPKPKAVYANLKDIQDQTDKKIILWKRTADGRLKFQKIIDPAQNNNTDSNSDSDSDSDSGNNDEANISDKFVADDCDAINVIEADKGELERLQAGHALTFRPDSNKPTQYSFRRHKTAKKDNPDYCYKLFGLAREDAFYDLIKNLKDTRVRGFLTEALNEAEQSEKFQQYLDKNKRKYLGDKDRKIKLYLEYDILYTKTSEGWPHPGVLYALAHLKKINLNLFTEEKSHELKLHPLHPLHTSGDQQVDGDSEGSGEDEEENEDKEDKEDKKDKKDKKNSLRTLNLVLTTHGSHHVDLLEPVRKEEIESRPVFFLAMTENAYNWNYTEKVLLGNKNTHKNTRKNLHHVHNPFHPHNLKLAGVHELIDHLDYFIYLKQLDSSVLSEQTLQMHCYAIEKIIEEICQSFVLLEQDPLQAAYLLNKGKIDANNGMVYLKEYRNATLALMKIFMSLKNDKLVERAIKKLWEVKQNANYRYTVNSEPGANESNIYTKDDEAKKAGKQVPPQSDHIRFLKLHIASDPTSDNVRYHASVYQKERTLEVGKTRSAFKEKIRKGIIGTVGSLTSVGATLVLVFYLKLMVVLPPLIVVTGIVALVTFLTFAAITHFGSKDVWKTTFRSIKEKADTPVNDVSLSFKSGLSNDHALFDAGKSDLNCGAGSNIDPKYLVFENDLSGIASIATKGPMATPTKTPRKVPLTPARSYLRQNTAVASSAVNAFYSPLTKKTLNSLFMSVIDSLNNLFVVEQSVSSGLINQKNTLLQSIEKIVENFKEQANELSQEGNSQAFSAEMSKQLQAINQVADGLIMLDKVGSLLPEEQRELKSGLDEMRAVMAIIVLPLPANEDNEEKRKMLLQYVKDFQNSLSHLQAVLSTQQGRIMSPSGAAVYIEGYGDIGAYQSRINKINARLSSMGNISKSLRVDIKNINDYLHQDEVDLNRLEDKLSYLEDKIKENNIIEFVSSDQQIVFNQTSSINDQYSTRKKLNERINACNRYMGEFDLRLPEMYKNLADKIKKEIDGKATVSYHNLSAALEGLEKAFTSGNISWNQSVQSGKPQVTRSPSKFITSSSFFNQSDTSASARPSSAMVPGSTPPSPYKTPSLKQRVSDSG